ncbi:hypothetical protein V1264_009750 [Littorina saxatilis]|uniref:Uncharacterized protein n=1 Tax=Littorina saxatilis TaxID=31220 RepID=A0AAN9ASV7_9CAEN
MLLFPSQNQKGVPSVERKVCVQPSGHATALQVFRQSDDGKPVMIENDTEISATAGEQIRGLTFKLLDEGDQEVSVSEKIAGKVKVNWVPKPSVDLLVKGQLPDIKAPTSTRDTKYCHLSYLDGSAVEIHFSVRAEAGEPARLICQVNGATQAEPGEVMPATISVSLADAYGNLVKIPNSAVKDFQVTSEDLVKKSLKLSVKENVLHIQNVKFDTKRVGVHRLTVSCKDMTETIPFEVTAGPPTALDMPDWDSELPVTVYTEDKLPFPVMAQLMDASGSPSCTPDIRVHITKDPKIKVRWHVALTSYQI